MSGHLLHLQRNFLMRTKGIAKQLKIIFLPMA